MLLDHLAVKTFLFTLFFFFFITYKGDKFGQKQCFFCFFFFFFDKNVIFIVYGSSRESQPKRDRTSLDV